MDAFKKYLQNRQLEEHVFMRVVLNKKWNRFVNEKWTELLSRPFFNVRLGKKKIVWNKNEKFKELIFAIACWNFAE